MSDKHTKLLEVIARRIAPERLVLQWFTDKEIKEPKCASLYEAVAKIDAQCSEIVKDYGVQVLYAVFRALAAQIVARRMMHEPEEDQELITVVDLIQERLQDRDLIKESYDTGTIASIAKTMQKTAEDLGIPLHEVKLHHVLFPEEVEGMGECKCVMCQKKKEKSN